MKAASTLLAYMLILGAVFFLTGVVALFPWGLLMLPVVIAFVFMAIDIIREEWF